MSPFVSVLYCLLFVAEIHAASSWIRLTGPEFQTEISNPSLNKNTTANEVSTREVLFVPASTTKFVPLNIKNITIAFYEPKNNPNRSHHSSNTGNFSQPVFINRLSTTTVIGLRRTSDEIQREFVTGRPVFKNDLNHGNKKLLDQIYELANTLETITMQEEKNLIYSPHIIFVPENAGDIVWQEDKMNGPEITILASAVRQLPIHSVIEMVVFREKNRSEFSGDIVYIETESIEEYPSESVLQIKFEKKYLSYPHGKWKCVYWDYRYSTWRDTGITTILVPQFVICTSTHLSAFSIILDPFNIWYDTENWHDSQHEFWLTTISVIGSWITICFLILVIIIHFQKRSEKETSKILINSSFALLLTHASYQIYTFLEEYCTCLVINFLTHYFVLAFLLWTAADGINMWRILFTSVFNTNGYVFYRWYKIICWGVPLVTTCIGLLFAEPRSNKKCMLRFDKTYDLIFYLIPCMLIFCCNLLLFTYMLIKMTCKNRLGRLKDKKIDYVLALTQVFGICWCVVFPLFFFSSTHLLGEYLSATVVSTQGVLIFIVRCGGDKDLRRRLQNSFMSKLSSSSVS